MKDLEYRDEWFKRHPVTVEWFGAQWLPNDLPDDHPLISVLQSAYQNETDRATIEASPWGTDGGLLYHAGDTPVIVFGPGKQNSSSGK